VGDREPRGGGCAPRLDLSDELRQLGLGLLSASPRVGSLDGALDLAAPPGDRVGACVDEEPPGASPEP
jgi:hypothetical protein